MKHLKRIAVASAATVMIILLGAGSASATTLEVGGVAQNKSVVFLSGSESTTNSIFGTLNCKTGAGTHLGTLTGTGDLKKHAELVINAAITCSGISAKWEATYIFTSPTGLGIVA